MLRTSVFLVASFGLLAGCASSSASSSNSNPPDAGKVDYDVGQPSGGGDGAGGAAEPADSGSGPKVQARDSTSTRGTSIGPKVVKRVAPTKPPKAEEPEPAAGKPKPGRVGRVEPHGLLGEVFAIPADTERLPDFSSLAAPKSLFIANNLDASESAPLVGLPKTVAAPVAIRFTGSLNVLTASEYKLCTASVDGSQLYLEETLIVDNDGVKQEQSEVCELVSLDPGEYMIELRSFHVSGPILVRLSWAEDKNGTPTTIPMRSLYKPEDADARVKAGK